MPALRRDGAVLRFLPAVLRDSSDVALDAVQTCGLAVAFASERVRADREVEKKPRGLEKKIGGNMCLFVFFFILYVLGGLVRKHVFVNGCLIVFAMRFWMFPRVFGQMGGVTSWGVFLGSWCKVSIALVACCRFFCSFALPLFPCSFGRWFLKNNWGLYCCGRIGSLWRAPVEPDLKSACPREKWAKPMEGW